MLLIIGANGQLAGRQPTPTLQAIAAVLDGTAK
jgi:hypothetical protein